MKKRGYSIDIQFIGRSHATEDAKDISHEEDEMRKLNIPFRSIITGRIQRFISVSSLLSFFKIPIGCLQAFIYCLKYRPVCIVSFGGYVAVPVVFSGWILGIPTITHEQTSVIGLSNRIIIRMAQKICVTFPDMAKEIPHAVYTGLPLRDSIVSLRRTSVSKNIKKPIIYITGGSTGAASVNTLIFSILPDLLEKYTVIHQTGRLSYDVAIEKAAMLSKNHRMNYTPILYTSANELVGILSTATLVVGRSGANTVYELAVLGIPALFIPLPWSGGGEQQKNAFWLKNAGSVEVLEQHHATPELLLEKIDTMLSQITHYQQRAIHFEKTIPRDGAKKFVDELAPFL